MEMISSCSGDGMKGSVKRKNQPKSGEAANSQIALHCCMDMEVYRFAAVDSRLQDFQDQQIKLTMLNC
jgi:hypothetical protein